MKGFSGISTWTFVSQWCVTACYCKFFVRHWGKNVDVTDQTQPAKAVHTDKGYLSALHTNISVQETYVLSRVIAIRHTYLQDMAKFVE